MKAKLTDRTGKETTIRRDMIDRRTQSSRSYPANTVITSCRTAVTNTQTTISTEIINRNQKICQGKTCGE
jgi:hypothetical protein